MKTCMNCSQALEGPDADQKCSECGDDGCKACTVETASGERVCLNCVDDAQDDADPLEGDEPDSDVDTSDDPILDDESDSGDFATPDDADEDLDD